MYRQIYIIFTPSLGVLKKQADAMFYPFLPEAKKSAIQKIGFGTVLKLFVLYPDRWWAESEGFPLIWDSKDIEDAKKQFPEGPQLVI